MKLTSKLSIILILLVFVILFSCSKEKEYPVIPDIKYNQFFYNSSNEEGNLIIGFTDGDGDIGLTSNHIFPPFDSTSIYHYNFYIDIYEKINGIYKRFVVFNSSTQQNDTIVFKYRIPFIEPVSANGSLKGEFTTKINIGLMLPFLHTDTLMFKAYIYDRALHKSNVINTPDFVFNAK